MGRIKSEETKKHCIAMSAMAAEKKRENFTGKTFGRLTGVGSCSGEPRYWLFDCSCGTKGFRSRKDSVKAGLIRSCGCLLKETASARGKLFGPKTSVDLTGHRFGKLVVVERRGSKKGNAVWLCRCDCGGQKEAMAGVLVRGDVASCGCAILNRETVRSEEARKRSGAYNARRRKIDSRFALTARMRTAVHQTMKRKGGAKAGRTFQLLGYSVEDLEARLRKTMPPGFTWEDFMSGALHIDHIIPLDAFNYTSVDDLDFKRAWALTNLQLMPAIENIQKNASLFEPFQPSLLLAAKS